MSDVNYFDKIRYLYPDICNVVYWQTQYDGTPWEDPYEGIVWENTLVAKPDKTTLDALDDKVVALELAARAETARKSVRNKAAQSNLALVGQFKLAHASDKTLTFSAYLDSLEELAATLGDDENV